MKRTITEHNTSVGDRDPFRSLRLASRQPKSLNCEVGFGEDAETCGRDACTPLCANTDLQRDSLSTFISDESIT